jgi:hypothetical protein
MDERIVHLSDFQITTLSSLIDHEVRRIQRSKAKSWKVSTKVMAIVDLQRIAAQLHRSDPILDEVRKYSVDQTGAVGED